MSGENNMINLLYCGNSKVFDGIVTSLLSILKRSKNDCYRIYLYTMELTRIKKDYTPVSDELIAFLNEMVKEFNAENEVMTLPEECRPATTVAWVSKGDTYASTNVSFPLLVKVTKAGVVSFTPIGNSVSLTTASDIWIDGTYVM